LKPAEKATLALVDGTVLAGRSFGAAGETTGEVVFHTGMTGYQEILTDPSYRGQIVTMTYTQIGNTGINSEDVESGRVWANGFIVKEYIDAPSNFRSEQTLGEYLRGQGIVAIEGLDTRFLTRHLRDHGSMTGIIATGERDPAELVAAARQAPGIVGRDLAAEVTCAKAYEFSQGVWKLGAGHEAPAAAPRLKVVAMDFGIKTNILRMLTSAGCGVTVVPAGVDADTILGLNPDGLLLSNGPGDPEGVPYAFQTIRTIMERRPELPIFGICLGHQLLGLALGAKTIKLKFGHHGANHPVMDLATREVAITSQNHNFSVPCEFFDRPDAPAVMTHVNLNDHTCEGMRHQTRPVFSIQYHPEASPGPHDAAPLFRNFVELMEER
jgi:carbamoyl-phosphate synthase small subunit